MNKKQVIERLVELIFSLSDELEKIEEVNPNDLWPLHPGGDPTEKFAAAKPLIDEILEIVQNVNGSQVSEEIILERLLYSTAAIRIQIKIKDEELQEIAERNVTALIDYRALRDVDVPLVSLDVGKETFEFGTIKLIPISDEDKETPWWKWASSPLGDMTDYLLLSYARVNVPGDVHTSIVNAKNIVNEALLVLRGIGFHITAEERHQIGIVGDTTLRQSIAFRPGRPTETTRIDSQSQLVARTGPNQWPYRLKEDLLTSTTPDRLDKLLELLKTYGFYPKPEIPARIISGFRWLGEATKPDVLAARFAKVAFSLEAFIGGESNNEFLTTKGITAMLAERAAFLISESKEERIQIDKNIRTYYRKRSAIAHGSMSEVSPEDFQKFGYLVRELGWSLIDKMNLFSNCNELQSWIVERRYSEKYD